MREFTATRWTVLQAARAGDTEAVHTFVAKYRPAVVAYLGRCGQQAVAEDLAQEVLLRLFHEGVLAGADPSKGRFRSLLLGVTRNVLGEYLRKTQALKRGGGKVRVPIEGTEPVMDVPNEAFDREWLAALLGRAMAKLAEKHESYFVAFRRAVLDGTPQADVAQDLDVTVGTIKKRVHRARRKLITYVEDEVWSYSSSPGEYDEELEYLSTFFPGTSLDGGS